MKLSRAGVILAFLPFAMFLGCAQGSGAHIPTTIIEASRVRSYHSIHQLTGDADAIVHISATKNHWVEYVGSGRTPFTVTVADVDRVLRGKVGGSTIKVRQLGSDGWPVVTDAPPLLEPRRSYVVFLQRFTFGPGHDTNQYVVVGGGAGLFGDQNGNLTRLDPQSPDLPATLPLADLQKLLGS